MKHNAVYAVETTTVRMTASGKVEATGAATAAAAAAAAALQHGLTAAAAF